MDESPTQVDSVESQGERSESGGFSWYAWLLVFVLVAYPLSVGPAVKLHRACPAARPTLEAIYKPVTFLCDHWRPAGTFFLWYVVVIWKAK